MSAGGGGKRAAGRSMSGDGGSHAGSTKPSASMRRFAGFVLVSTIAGVFNLPAIAADLPSRMEPVAPVAYVPAFSWTGFYVGGELGWIQTTPNYTTGALLLGAPFAVTSGSDKNGLTYGILAGYNYQVGQLVLGVEGDFQGWTVGEIRYTAITGDFLTAHSKWGGSIRGRLGYAVDHALLYVSGGAAFVSNETSSRLPESQSVATARVWVGRLEQVSITPSRTTGSLARIPLFPVPIEVLCISNTYPESWLRRL